MFAWLKPKPSLFLRGESHIYHPLDSCLIGVNERLESYIPDSFIEGWEAMQHYTPEGVVVKGETAPVAGAEVACNIQPTPLDLSEGEPDCFYEGDGDYPYHGQETTKRRISTRIDTLRPEERFKCLIVGPAGCGKTTISRIVAKMLNSRRLDLGLEEGPYYEVLPAQLEERGMLDQLMLEISKEPYAILFVDEVHKLSERERWFHFLHDSGQSRWPMMDGRMIDIPRTVSVLAATTDPGELDSAMRRRLEPEFRLEEPDVETLAQIVHDTAKGFQMEVDEESALLIAERSHYPWFAKMIFNEVQLLARVAKTDIICLQMAEEGLDLLEIDSLGLRREDRDVIASLLRVPRKLVSKDVTRYSMSEEALCAASGIDRGTYKKRIQPKLLRLGLLMTLGGQCLTDRAVSLYGNLIE